MGESSHHVAALPRRRGHRLRSVGAAALLAAALAGCTSSRPAASTTRHGPPVASPALFPSGSRRAVAAQYLLIAREGNRRLEVDFDGLEEGDWGDLAAASADLRDAAATERLFDRRLLAITFPPALESVARTLYAVNEARASLTIKAAGSTSLAELRGYEPLLDDANGPVERRVRIIRKGLGLPPPETS